MEVLEGQNILVTISGKHDKIRVYYLSWLKTKIFKSEGVSTVCLPPQYIFKMLINFVSRFLSMEKELSMLESDVYLAWFIVVVIVLCLVV